LKHTPAERGTPSTAAAPPGRDDRRFTLTGRRFPKTTVFLPRRRAASPKLPAFYPDGMPSGRKSSHFTPAARRLTKTTVFSPRRRAV